MRNDSRARRAFAAFAAMLVVASLAGCAAVVPAPGFGDDQRVLVARELRGAVKAQVDESWTADRRLEANVVIRNVTNRSLLVYVSTTFLDANGIALNPEPVQDAIIINVGQDYTYSKSSLSESARDFSVRILKGRSY